MSVVWLTPYLCSVIKAINFNEIPFKEKIDKNYINIAIILFSF